MARRKLFPPLFLIFTLSFLSLLFNFLFNTSKQLNTPGVSLKLIPPKPTPTPKLTTLMAVGDIMLSRKVNLKMLEYKDWKYPFLKTARLLRSADITFGNLESPFTDNCQSFVTGMSFCARKEAIEGIKYAGFSLLGLSNNHIYNHGKEGKNFTINLLAQNNIQYADENNLAIYQFNNVSSGFLAFDLTINNNPQPILTAVKKYAPQVDILIVSLHWGVEYEKEPRKWQKDLAYQIIDSGAKLIIGSHPHVTQPTEEYNNGLIFYSLGNFVFDQMWSEETKRGKIAKIVFEGKNIKSFEEIPIYIVDYSQPQIFK